MRPAVHPVDALAGLLDGDVLPVQRLDRAALGRPGLILGLDIGQRDALPDGEYCPLEIINLRRPLLLRHVPVPERVHLIARLHRLNEGVIRHGQVRPALRYRGVGALLEQGLPPM